MHQAIAKILQHVPTGQQTLFTILENIFPHKRFTRNILTDFVSHLLKMCDYLPLLQHRIFDLIIRKCLEMDVEIVIEDSGDVRIQKDYDYEELEAYPEDIFEFDDPIKQRLNTSNLNNTNNNHDLDTTIDHNTNKPRIPKEVAELADKLDSILVLLIAYLDKQFASPLSVTSSTSLNTSLPTSSAPTFTSIERLLHQFTLIFEQRLLTAHKSKFVQFLIFYLAAKNNHFAETFAKNLLYRGQDNSQSSILRQASIMYLSSYLSRALFLSPSFVK